MSLDGLRAWIGEVERKLTMRTRVFLALVAIAVGGAGAGIYLAIDAQNSAVSKADLEAVRDELAEAGGEADAGEAIAALEAQLQALQAEVRTLQAEAGSAGKGASKAPSQPGDGAEDGTRGAGSEAVSPKNQERLEELVEGARDQTEE